MEITLLDNQKTCKEMLIVLLYCVMTRTDGNTRDFDFALTHAVTLAEAGRTISEKRIGTSEAQLYACTSYGKGH